MPRFLIVDDSTFSRMNLRGLLEENGHEVVAEARDADEAVSLYKTAKPDIVTMDLNMPRKTGVDAMRDILAVDPQARFIVITAIDSKLMTEGFPPASACEYVRKPVDWKKLRAAIARADKNSRAQD